MSTAWWWRRGRQCAPYSGAEIETGDVIYEMNRMPDAEREGPSARRWRR